MKTYPLYTAVQTKEFDALAIQDENISGYCLMQRAALAAFNAIVERWPKLKSIVVLCGMGNNAGDGYVIAKLAREHGISVNVIQLGDVRHQQGAARLAREDLDKSLSLEAYGGQGTFEADLIVDAIFGTGLARGVEGEWANAIQAINSSACSVVAIDIPSGLQCDTGAILGTAVRADFTVTFIARKQGMYTADGPELCGEILFEGLKVSEAVYQQISPSSYCIDKLTGPLLKRRSKNSHKKDFGHLLLVGGAPGMRGAIHLAAQAALRSGVGLVTVATHPDHASFFNLTTPEVMVYGVSCEAELLPLMDNADVIVAGPGLGQSSWARELFACLCSGEQPLVVDADALNLLCKQKQKRDNWVLTPHPGEAARLLDCTSKHIQNSRFDAAEQIQKEYGGICVLKGSGTIICSDQKKLVCPYGNPGMATAGMGDILAGVIGSMIAQSKSEKLALIDIAQFAVVLHALAGDRAAVADGEKGMIASDLLPYLRLLINE